MPNINENFKLELNFEWEDCTLVYDCLTREKISDINDKAFFDYYNNFIKSKYENEYNIWYDTVSGNCFSGAQFVDSKNAGKFQHFFSPKNRFINTINNHMSGYANDKSPFKNENLFIDPYLDYVCTKQDKLKERFKNKKIMIVGGGPSTNLVNWENVKYDSLWTCNEYYKNDKLKNKKIDFVSFAPLVDGSLNSGSDLEKSVIDNKDLLVSFPIDRSGYSYDPVLKFGEKYIDRTCLYQTRYASVVGTMNRLICLAIFFGAKEVMFVGMDGRAPQEKNGNLLHAFDGDKPLPSWYKNYGDRFQQRQFVIFYDYIAQLKNRFDFKLYNLGESYKFNASRNITQKSFPLTDTIKRKIGYENG